MEIDLRLVHQQAGNARSLYKSENRNVDASDTLEQGGLGLVESDFNLVG